MRKEICSIKLILLWKGKLLKRGNEVEFGLGRITKGDESRRTSKV